MPTDAAGSEVRSAATSASRPSDPGLAGGRVAAVELPDPDPASRAASRCPSSRVAAPDRLAAPTLLSRVPTSSVVPDRDRLATRSSSTRAASASSPATDRRRAPRDRRARAHRARLHAPPRRDRRRRALRRRRRAPRARSRGRSSPGSARRARRGRRPPTGSASSSCSSISTTTRRAQGRAGRGRDALRGRGPRARRLARRPDRRDPARRPRRAPTCPRSGRRSSLRPDGVDDARGRARARTGPAARAEARCRERGVRHYFASWGFSTVTYKALVISDRLAAFFPDLARRRLRRAARDLPQPLLDEHDAGLGARAAVPHALPQRRDQHGPGQRAPDARARPRSAPRRSGSAPRSCSARCSTRTTPTPASSTRRSSCCVRGGRDVRHAIAMLVPEAWEGNRDLDARRARLLPLPRVPHRAVGRSGRARVHRRPPRRRRARPQRAAPAALAARATTAPSCARPRPARCRSTVAARVRRGRLGPGEMLCVDPERGGPSQAGRRTVKRCSAARARRTAIGRADGLAPYPVGDADRDAARRADELVARAGRVRRDEGGGGDGAQADGDRRQGAHVLDGRRHPARRRRHARRARCSTSSSSGSRR